ncbi:hypothetical protein [Brevibacterium renqingii]|uniref:hypothetical protein n=1 Tax=Brevibacterium renqingii TaxID=2776916 RepID=UPI001ADFA6FF|nr:hypothetical protein [Brevibacterium renqingii]
MAATEQNLPGRWPAEAAVFLRRSFAICCFAALGSLGYFAVSGRFDFAAHYLAGVGGGLILIAMAPPLVAWASRRGHAPERLSGLLVVLATLLAIGIGMVIEYRVFGDPTADWSDIVHQSLGAACIGLICVLAPEPPGTPAAAAVKGSALIGLGLVMIAMGASFVGLL